MKKALPDVGQDVLRNNLVFLTFRLCGEQIEPKNEAEQSLETLIADVELPENIHLLATKVVLPIDFEELDRFWKTLTEERPKDYYAVQGN